MYFDSPFRHVGTIDPEPLVQVIESMGETAWNEYVVRQELFEPHRHTHAIPLLFDLDGRHENPTPDEVHEPKPIVTGWRGAHPLG